MTQIFSLTFSLIEQKHQKVWLYLISHKIIQAFIIFRKEDDNACCNKRIICF